MSLGAQDAYLSISPQVSFFKRGYKRVSNYAVEAIDHSISSISWGKEIVTPISRNGDLMTDMWLLVDVNLCRLADSNQGQDAVHWTNVLGHAMIRNAIFEVGSAEIDKLTGQYMEIKHEYESNVNRDTNALVLRSSSPQQLINWTHDGNTLDVDGTPTTQLYVKLPFWFSKARSQSLPVIALQYHDIRMRLNLREKSKLLMFTNPANTQLDPVHNGEISKAVYMTHFVYLDAFERKMFVETTHEYLIRNVQESTFNTKPSGARQMSVQVNFNHPISAIYWVVQRKALVDGNDWMNFERTPNQGDDTITSATIKFNGSERERPRGPLYWRTILSSEYFARTPTKPIYTYSWAAAPSSWTPTGSFNASRIDRFFLEFTLPATDANGDAFGEADVTIYAENFNVIVIQGGMMSRRYAA